MAAKRRGDLIPLAVRIALLNAVGGSGPFTVREIDDLFHSHEFTEEDLTIEDAGGQRRSATEGYHARIDWSSPDQAQRYLNLVADVLDYYPAADEEPRSPGRKLRLALSHGDLVLPDGRLRLPSTLPAQQTEPDIEGIWTPDRPRVFLSHSSLNRPEVNELAQTLEALNCSCFVAHVDIEPSLPWQRTIERALRTSHVLIAYVTPEFRGSKWTDQEVGWVLGRGIPVISVNAGEQPYGFFGSFQSVPSAATPSLGYAVFRAIAVACLRENLADDPDRGALVARAIVESFCGSRSYESTRRRFELLTLVPLSLWTDEMAEALEAATKNNNQISNAVLTNPPQSVPDLIRDLLGRIARTPSL